MLRDFCHDKASLTRAPEGSTKYGKEQPVPVTANIPNGKDQQQYEETTLTNGKITS